MYALNLVGSTAVYQFNIAGGKPARIVDLTGFHPTGYLSFWFGLDPDDKPLLLRDNGANDIYALTLEVK